MSNSETKTETEAEQKKDNAGLPPIDPEDMHALVIDDEYANRDFFTRLLQQAQLKVVGTDTSEKARKLVDELGDKVVLVMLDHRLPDGSGIDLLADIKPKLPHAKILIATMHDERSMMREAFEGGCCGFMVKPHGFMDLFKMIQNVKQDPSVLNDLDNLIFDQHGVREWRG